MGDDFLPQWAVYWLKYNLLGGLAAEMMMSLPLKRAVLSQKLHGGLAAAEISIDFLVSSELSIAEGCRIDSYCKAMMSLSLPDPSEHNGVAMFLSQCEVIRWRYDFIEQLLKLVHIDMREVLP